MKCKEINYLILLADFFLIIIFEVSCMCVYPWELELYSWVINVSICFIVAFFTCLFSHGVTWLKISALLKVRQRCRTKKKH
jgi:hypothetical protein